MIDLMEVYMIRMRLWASTQSKVVIYSDNIQCCDRALEEFDRKFGITEEMLKTISPYY